MKKVPSFKKKYLEGRDMLFGSLIKNNNGVLFNKSHGNLVDQLIIEIVKDIQITFPVSDFCLIAVGGYGRHDLSPKSDVDLLFIYKKSKSILKAEWCKSSA